MISIVICSADRQKTEAITTHYKSLLGPDQCDLILIQDARSLAEGYNRGVSRSKGDLIIFSHDDVEILVPDLMNRLNGHFHGNDIVGVAGTSRLSSGYWMLNGPPHIHGQVAHLSTGNYGYRVCIYGAPSPAGGAIQALDGLFLACRKTVFSSLRFDEETFDGFHCYDTDFTFAAYLAGFRLRVTGNIPILHASRGNHNHAWSHYMRRFALKYRDRLAPTHDRVCQNATVDVRTKQELLNVMLAA